MGNTVVWKPASSAVLPAYVIMQILKEAGSWLNLQRWVSPRTIKETFLPPRDFRYPYMDKE